MQSGSVTAADDWDASAGGDGDSSPTAASTRNARLTHLATAPDGSFCLSNQDVRFLLLLSLLGSANGTSRFAVISGVTLQFAPACDSCAALCASSFAKQ